MTTKLMGLHKHELVETARLFSGEGDKIDVVFHDGGACMSEGIIKLPNTAPDVALSEKGQRFDRAMVDHEAGHVAISTMGPMQRHAGDNRMMSLLNGIEDCRVEKYVTEKHPGSRKNLGTARDIVYEGMAEKIMASDDARKFVGANINNAWWEKYGGWPSENRKRAFEALPEALQDFCRRYADLANKLKTTKGSGPTCRLAEKALEELVQMGPMPPEQEGGADVDGGTQQSQPEGAQPNQNQGNNEQEQESEQSSEERSEVDEADADAEEQGGGPNDDEQDGDAKGQDGEAANDAGDFDKETECEDGDLAKHHEDVRREESTEKVGSAIGGCGPKDQAPELIDVSTRQGYAAVVGRHKRGIWEALVENQAAVQNANNPQWFERHWSTACRNVKATVAPTQAKLQEAFMAAAQRNWSGGHEFGSLDPKSLVRAYQGREGAFRRKDSGQDIDAAVTLLVDCSGSMSGRAGGRDRKMVLAAEMALALSMVLERMGVAVEVRGFNGNWNGGATDCYHVDWLFKPFAKTVRQCRDGLGSMRFAYSGGNVDYVHLQSAASTLMKREEAKKLLIVLSDGGTCGSWGEMQRLCRAIHDTTPITLFGVGVCSPAVSDYYPDYVVVRDTSDLSRVVAGRISRALMGRGLNAVKEAA